MKDSTIMEAAPKADAEYEAAIESYLGEMARLKNDMDERQKRIDKSRRETEAMLATLATSPLAP